MLTWYVSFDVYKRDILYVTRKRLHFILVMLRYISRVTWKASNTEVSTFHLTRCLARKKGTVSSNDVTFHDVESEAILPVITVMINYCCTYRRLRRDRTHCRCQWRSSSSGGVGTVPGTRRFRDARRPLPPPWRRAMSDTCHAVAPSAREFAHR